MNNTIVNDDGQTLVIRKCIAVIISCETEEQLILARRFTNLAIRASVNDTDAIYWFGYMAGLFSVRMRAAKP